MNAAGWLAELLVAIQTFLVVLVAIAGTNWVGWRRLASARPNGARPVGAGLPSARASAASPHAAVAAPHVSILIPARDEAHQIRACVASLLAQDYPAFDVVVLDDGSTDGTGHILAALAADDPRLRVLSGTPLPEGWTGKNWACRQLAEAACGDLLLFTDADTRHDPRALADAVALLLDLDADLVSVLPEQSLRSWGERLLVPILPWSLFACYPSALAARLRWPPLVMAVGQVMLFRRTAYDGIGGHGAVRARVTEDIALAQRLTAAGGRVRLVDGTGRVACRMYTGFRSAWDGLGRSLFDAFGRNPWAFAPIWAWLGVAFLLPPALVLLWLLGAITGATTAATATATPALAATGLGLLSWAIVVVRFRLPIRLVCLYPAVMAAAVAVAAHSLALGLRGGATWKGRPVPVAR